MASLLFGVWPVAGQASVGLRGPFAGEAEGGAAPFFLNADAETRERALRCMAAAIYYEAADQPETGQAAVAQVVLNRVRHPNYPKSVCAVVYQGAPARGCQFTFACDGSEDRAPDVRGWRLAMSVAARALGGYVENTVGTSTHYHNMTVRPEWSAAMAPTVRIGQHQFYRFLGVAGDVSAFSGVYSGVEPVISPTPQLSSAAYVRPLRLVRPRPVPGHFSVWGVEIATVKPAGQVSARTVFASGVTDHE